MRIEYASPLIGYYYAMGDLFTVDGLGEIDAVAKSIANVLDRATAS
jgi:adenylate kinase